MKVRFLDLRVKEKQLREDLLSRVEKVLLHGRIIDGPEQVRFEELVAQEIGVRYAVGVGSGSSALFLALKAAGIGPGNEVITSPFTWIISANAVAATGATIRFADIGHDFNLDPDAVERVVNKSTRAILPVHIGGHMCDMMRLQDIASRHGAHIVEDAAQAFSGSLFGKCAGSFSTAAGFSMNPMKVLHAYGEAGVVTTNSKRVYDRIKMLRHAGTRRDPAGRHINRCFEVSLNHKMDTLQAALLISSLKRLPHIMKARNLVARTYDEGLKDVVDLQKLVEGERHGRYLYLIGCRRRNELQKVLFDHGIETKIFYSPLVCDAPIYRQSADVPTARKMLKKALALPMHENLTLDQVSFVVDKIRAFYR